MQKSPLILSKVYTFLLSFFLILIGIQVGWSQKASRQVLRSLQIKDKVDVVIQFKTTDMRPLTAQIPDKTAKGRLVYQALRRQANQSQTQVIAQLKTWNVPFHSYWVTNIIATTLSAQQIERIAQFPQVTQILSDAPVTFSKPIAYKKQPIQLRGGPKITWGIRRIKADSVWSMGIRGKGVVVAGQDTGYKWDVDGIKDKYRGYDGQDVDHNFNWHDAIVEYNPNLGDSANVCGLNLHAPCDDHGHGTHTMGTMVGENDTLLYGVAPESKWIGCRCMERGWGKPSSYIDCFEWFIAPTDTNGMHPDPAMAPHVINNSWGCPLNEGCNPDNFDIMNNVVNNVKAAGIVVVVSAGNDGRGGCSTIRNPAAIYESSFSVGALHPNDTIANFSSRGPVRSDSSHRTKPDITAPGVRVLSQVPDGSLRSWGGTSMAGPHVAGVVALMISANPLLAGQVDVIQNIISSTARRKFSPVDSCDVDPMSIPNNVYGYGVINALAAVRKALEWKSTSTRPSLHNDILVSPNPTKGLLKFESISSDLIIHSIRFSTLSGQALKITPFFKEDTQWNFDFTTLPRGIYLYKITTPSGISNGRFVKI